MKKSLNFYIFFFIPYLITCQVSNLMINDIQSWNSFELEYKKINKTELSLESSVRFDNNLKNLSKTLIDLNVKREYNKHIDYAVGVRYDQRKDDNLLEERVRCYFDFYFRFDIYTNIILKSRTRYQFHKLQDEDFNNNVDFNRKIRQKFTLNNDLDNNKINIYLASELFYKIGSGFEKYRFVSGLKSKISKKITASLSGLFESEFTGDSSFFALRTKLTYSI